MRHLEKARTLYTELIGTLRRDSSLKTVEPVLQDVAREDDNEEHFRRLRAYSSYSRIMYKVLLGGSQHFGFYPKDRKVSEREAQLLLNGLVAQRLELKSSDHALDAGSGNGIVASYLARNFGCKITGVTMVPFEIESARRRARDEGVSDRVDYHLMDYSSTNFGDNTFDCVYTTETLSQAIDLAKTMGEFHRITKPNGRIALFEYTISNDSDFSKRELEILRVVCNSSAMDGLSQFRHDTIKTTIEAAGFHEVRIEDVSRNMEPSLRRLRRVMYLPYMLFVKPFELQEYFPNATATVEFYNMADKGLIRYNIITGRCTKD